MKHEGTRQEVDLVVRDAGELLTCAGPGHGIAGDALERIGLIEGGALAVRAGRIVAVGTTAAIDAGYRAREVIEAAGALVSPGFVDPHSHLLHGGTRHQEYESKVTGSGSPAGLESGINCTVRQTRSASDDRLVGQALADLDVMLEHVERRVAERRLDDAPKGEASHVAG